MTHPQFSHFKIEGSRMLFDYSANTFPSKLHSFGNNEYFYFDNKDSTYFVYCWKGLCNLQLEVSEHGQAAGIHYSLHPGMYACVPSGSHMIGGEGIVIERLNYKGMFQIGGPVENWGRLKYIDGCTDSLLVPPVKFGDACLNALFFPENINQTQHTHPSMRVGMVTKGKGYCMLPPDNDKTKERDCIPLVPGLVFIIHEDGLHSFKTESGEGMTVIAYHPDSDFGPQDEKHPMINRTIVDGVSASELKDIQTK